MTHVIAQLFLPLLRLLWPAKGRHRSIAAAARSATLGAHVPTAPTRCAPALRGEDTPLVRPYLIAHEQRMKVRQQRARRRALWFAVHGVDLGPRRIHGVEVAW
ncbi:hypothetical protein [Streptomyces boluensis]|uniref:Uncharacterized protein n=1 Tax=Streptomyces boluensis TaxID=1775135 RepID=A0A964UK23_9ACTN|nr:hypothetical protein [Streptomyces boluensis]NBE50624.1 hypothetical protein [Streptomyces boluensis]